MFGWGVVIYAVVFLVWSGFLTYGFIEGMLPRILGFAALVAATSTAALSLRLSTWYDVLPYSLSWMVVVMLLDGIFSFPFVGFAIYADPNVWVGYALVAIVPLAAIRIASFYRRPHSVESQ